MTLVCDHLNLLEKDYFGLNFADSDNHKVGHTKKVPILGYKQVRSLWVLQNISMDFFAHNCSDIKTYY